MKDYAAKLLFQFRVMVDRSPGVRRTCEDRIVRLPAKKTWPRRILEMTNDGPQKQS